LIGVLYNCAFIVLGAFAGRCLRRILNDKVIESLVAVLGLVTVVIAIKIASRFENILLVMACLLFGGAIGTALQLEAKLERWLVALQNRWAAIFSQAKAESKKQVSQVILNTSVLYCTGAMAILGPIESALRNNHEILITKGILDGTFALTLAAIYGPVLALTAIPVLLFQGAIAFFALQLEYLNDPSTLNDLSGVGGILLLMIGLSVLNLRKFPIGNFLPAIFLYLFYTGMRSQLG
jgi:uncharacterized protein